MPIRQRTTTEEIPTSSLADIAFLLIVYFMLTATFTATGGLDFRLPEEDEQAREIDPIASVLVEVLPDRSLRVDGRPLPLADLLEYLRPRLTANPDKPVIISPDAAAPYGAMVAVLDELRRGRDLLERSDEIVVALPTARERERFWS